LKLQEITAIIHLILLEELMGFVPGKLFAKVTKKSSLSYERMPSFNDGY